MRLTIAFLLTASALRAQASADIPPVSTGRVAAQIGAGIPASLIGFFGGGLATRAVAFKFGATEDGAARAAYVGAIAFAALSTAGTATLIGSRAPVPDGTPKVHGSFGAAVAGATAGGIVSALLRKVGRKGALGERGPVAILAGVAIFALPSVGATVAYNATRSR